MDNNTQEQQKFFQRVSGDNALSEMMALCEKRRQNGLHTWTSGFENLDSLLRGGNTKSCAGGYLAGSLVILGALSSLGKTSFAVQMATEIAVLGQSVLYFSLEMSRPELMAKIVSRYSVTMQEHYTKNKTEIKNFTTLDILRGGILKAHENYYKYCCDCVDALASKITIVENKDLRDEKNPVKRISVIDIQKILEAYIKNKNTKPMIVVDYLQILEPATTMLKADRRNQIDFDITILKNIAEQFEVPVFVVSAFNRASYLEPVTLNSYKESGCLEYSADVLLGMQYYGVEYQKESDGKLEDPKSHTARVRDLFRRMNDKMANGSSIPIELCVLKNRNGIRGRCFYKFHPRFNNFEVCEENVFREKTI